MQKDDFTEAYKTINEVEDLLQKADALYLTVPEAIRQTILDYHSPRATLQYCLRWGLQAASDIREDWHRVFLMRDITVSSIRKLKDANGQYLWQPSVQAGEPDRLLGYRLYTSPYVPLVEADALPVAFGDFSNYWIADRMGRSVQRLIELFAGNGQIGFIGTQRVDAKVILAEGIKLLQMGA